MVCYMSLEQGRPLQATGLFGGAGVSSPQLDAEAGTGLESTPAALKPNCLGKLRSQRAKDNNHRKIRKY